MRNFRHLTSFALTLAALPVACCATIAGGAVGAFGAVCTRALGSASRVARPDTRPPMTEPDAYEIARQYREDIAMRRQMS